MDSDIGGDSPPLWLRARPARVAEYDLPAALASAHLERLRISGTRSGPVFNRLHSVEVTAGPEAYRFRLELGPTWTLPPQEPGRLREAAAQLGLLRYCELPMWLERFSNHCIKGAFPRIRADAIPSYYLDRTAPYRPDEWVYPPIGRWRLEVPQEPFSYAIVATVALPYSAIDPRERATYTSPVLPPPPADAFVRWRYLLYGMTPELSAATVYLEYRLPPNGVQSLR